MKAIVKSDLSLDYLKWILNNLNHIQKLKIDFRCEQYYPTVDAKYIQRYCLPDQTKNLIDYKFSVITGGKIPSLDSMKDVQSFRIDPFFVDHGWTNVRCLFDVTNLTRRIFSCFHLLTSKSAINLP